MYEFLILRARQFNVSKFGDSLETKAKLFQVGGLERSLGDTRQDNKKVAATLESIMKSHTQLQFTVEGKIHSI